MTAPASGDRGGRVPRRPRALWLVAALLLVALALAAGCGDDDGTGVRNIGATSGSGSGTGSGSASASGPASASGVAGPSGPSQPFGGYEPASDVGEQARVSLDVALINGRLDEDPVDFEGAGQIYREGRSSVRSDGTVRSLAGFATEERSEPVWDDYVAFYDDPRWLDTFASAGLEGTGPFAGASPAVRRQGVQKGVQNGVMVAWVLHELESARADAAEGRLDPAEGAPHKVDEAWAFYHGEDPAGAPYATADARGADFGTDGAVNAAVLHAMEAARDAAAAGDREALDAAVEEVRRQVVITYVQAALKYSRTADAALAAGDAEEARIQQAEGHAFFRVVAPLVARADEQAARAVLGELDVASAPRPGLGDRVAGALRGQLEALGIRDREVGSLSP